MRMTEWLYTCLLNGVRGIMRLSKYYYKITLYNMQFLLLHKTRCIPQLDLQLKEWSFGWRNFYRSLAKYQPFWTCCVCCWWWAVARNTYQHVDQEKKDVLMLKSSSDYKRCSHKHHNTWRLLSNGKATTVLSSGSH